MPTLVNRANTLSILFEGNKTANKLLVISATYPLFYDLSDFQTDLKHFPNWICFCY